MAVFRFLAAVFLLVATVALVIDATPFVYGAGSFAATSSSAHWQDLSPNSLLAARQAVTATAPWLWNSVIGPVLDLPTFVTFTLLSFLAGYLGRRQRRVRIFVN